MKELFVSQDNDSAVWQTVCRNIEVRHSVRGYVPTPVPRSVVEEILRVAARSPSGTNTQPWHVHVVSGESRARVAHAVCTAFDIDPQRSDQAIYTHLDDEPYRSRKRALGKAMYGLMGIGKDENEKMLAQQRRNFEFFGAPVGLFVTIDKALGCGSWLDTGMFVQSLMLAAKACGLDTCAQGFWVHYEAVVAQVVGWPESERLVCGMALGYADESLPENALRSERMALEDFAVFHA